MGGRVRLYVAIFFYLEDKKKNGREFTVSIMVAYGQFISVKIFKHTFPATQLILPTSVHP